MNINQAINSWEQGPFARGKTDCCAFVDHVLFHLTGKQYLPQYDDDEGAEAIVRSHGCLQNAVTHYLGQPMVAAHELTAGDVALICVFDQETIGILMPNGNIAVVFEQAGLREIRPDFIDGGWRIGH